MLTSITIAGLETYAYHGLFEQERTLGQKFVLDIEAELRSGSSHQDDRLASSVRYDAVVEEAVLITRGGPYQTLETLGERIAQGLLTRFDPVNAVTISVAKLSPPIPHPLNRVAVKVRVDRREIGPGGLGQAQCG